MLMLASGTRLTWRYEHTKDIMNKTFKASNAKTFDFPNDFLTTMQNQRKEASTRLHMYASTRNNEKSLEIPSLQDSNSHHASPDDRIPSIPSFTFYANQNKGQRLY